MVKQAREIVICAGDARGQQQSGLIGIDLGGPAFRGCGGQRGAVLAPQVKIKIGTQRDLSGIVQALGDKGLGEAFVEALLVKTSAGGCVKRGQASTMGHFGHGGGPLNPGHGHGNIGRMVQPFVHQLIELRITKGLPPFQRGPLTMIGGSERLAGSDSSQRDWTLAQMGRRDAGPQHQRSQCGISNQNNAKRQHKTAQNPI